MINYPFHVSDYHYHTDFIPKLGYSVGLEIDDVYLLTFPVKITTRIN